MRKDNNEYMGDDRFEYERLDCGVIAIAYAFGLTYPEAHAHLKSKGRKDGGLTSVRSLEWPRGKSGEFKMVKIGDRKFLVTYYSRPSMTVDTFAKKMKSGIFVVMVNRHMFTIKEGLVLNNTKGSKRIEEYYKIQEVI